MDSEQDKIIIQQVKDLYYNCKIKECIQFIEEDHGERGSYCSQMLQLYKGLSQYKAQQINEALLTFKKLMDKNKEIKGNKADELDVLIYIFYQLETQYFHVPLAEQFNENLLQICEQYREQNENLESYQKGVYLYGKGLYIFIETRREGVDLQSIQYMEEALNCIKEFSNEIILTISWCHFVNQNHQLSCQWYEKIYEINPRFPSLANNYALVLEQLPDLEKAEKLYLLELEMRWYNQVIINNLSIFYRDKMNDVEKSKQFQEKLINLKPTTGRIYHLHGVYLNKQGQQQEAIDLFKKGIEIDPSYVSNYEQLSEIYINTDLQQSINLIEKCIEIYPKDGYLYTSLARRYDIQQNRQKALELYKQSIQLKNYREYKIFSYGRLASQYIYLKNYLQAFIYIFKVFSYQQPSSQFPHYYTLCARICKIKYLPLQTITKIINEQSGCVVTRFQSIANHLEDNDLQALFLLRLDYLRDILFIISFRKHVQNHLIFKNNILYWDLFID